MFLILSLVVSFRFIATFIGQNSLKDYDNVQIITDQNEICGTAKILNLTQVDLYACAYSKS